MKWILACVLGLVMCVNADARPHFKGKLRHWRQSHTVRHHRNWGHRWHKTKPVQALNHYYVPGPPELLSVSKRGPTKTIEDLDKGPWKTYNEKGVFVGLTFGKTPRSPKCQCGKECRCYPECRCGDNCKCTPKCNCSR